MKHCIFETKWGSVHYWISEEIIKSRLTVFFMHGLTASHELFKSQMEYFFDKYNVIVWDAPAHGLSRPFEEFTYEKAAEIAKGILEANNISSAVFVGQSLGGYITQSVIKRYPEIVRAFISVDSTPFGDKYYTKTDKWLLRQIEWMSKCYPGKALKNAIAKQCTNTDKAYENMRDMVSVYTKKELCHLMGIGYAGFLDDSCDLKINCPVMLIVGKKDVTGKVQSYNEAWSKDLNIPITWIDNAAHNANDDQPELVNEQIYRFLLEVE